MKRERFTIARITAFGCPAGTQQVFLWDTEAPRLAVRATSGAKSFVFETKLDGKTIRTTIGDVRAWNLDNARAEARRLQTLVDQGQDPREIEREKREAKAAEKAAREAAKQAADNQHRYTLRALCEAYIDHLRAKGKTDSARQTASILKCHVFDANPEIAALPAASITSLQVASMVRKVIEQGKERTAGVLRSYLLAAFNAARKAPFDARLPSALIEFGIDTNPADPIATIPVNRGERSLNADELRQYILALGDDLADTVLRLTLYTGGQRMAQLLRAKVSDYDEQTQTLRIWDAKGKRQQPREHLLPLAPRAAEMVDKLIERAKQMETEAATAAGLEPTYSALWLFSSTGRAPMVATTPGKRVAAIAKAMKGEPFDLRDLRRTCETMLAGLHISKDDRAQLLSHGISGVQAAHYDRHSYTDEKRSALIAWERRLEEIRTGKASRNVVDLHSKKDAVRESARPAPLIR